MFTPAIRATLVLSCRPGEPGPVLTPTGLKYAASGAKSHHGVAPERADYSCRAPRSQRSCINIARRPRHPSVEPARGSASTASICRATSSMSAMPSTVRRMPVRRVVRQDRRGLAVIGLEPRRHRLAVVVGAAGELVRAADVADAGHRGRLERVVVAGAALGAGEAAGDAVDQRRVVHLQLDDRVELHALLGQHPVERLGLRHGAREAVQDEAVGRSPAAPPGCRACG